MASESFLLADILPSCPGAWPVTEPTPLRSNPILDEQIAPNSTEGPYASGLQTRKRSLQPPKQATLRRAVLNGAPTLSLSGDRVTTRRTSDAYSTLRFFQRGKRIRGRALKQTTLKESTIKQIRRNSMRKISLDDINELCEALARLSLPKISKANRGSCAPYVGLRTPIYKRNKVCLQRPSVHSSFGQGSSSPSTPESSNSSPRSIFSSTSTSPATPYTPPLSPSPSPLVSKWERQSNDLNRSSGYFALSSSSTFSLTESSPCPHSRTQRVRLVPTDQQVDGNMRRNCANIGAEPIYASPISSFTRHKRDQRTQDMLDHNIADLLIKGPRAVSDKNNESRIKESKGFIYVISRPTSKGFVKIGKSIDPEKRRRRISKGGTFGDLTLHDDRHQRPFQHFTFSETIVAAELYNIRYDSRYGPTLRGREYSSSSEDGYTEWYNTTPDHANDVKAKWRDWLDCEPYDENGQLVSFWRNIIKNREKYDEAKHGDMHARWSTLLKQPTKFQLRLFQVRCVLSAVFKGFQCFQQRLPRWALLTVIGLLLVLLL
jgi:hypothetical protein